MWIKRLYYFGLLILPSIILGQQWTPIFSNGMEKEIMPNSLLKECHSGPIVWSNCREKGKWMFPSVSQLWIKFQFVHTSYNFDTRLVVYIYGILLETIQRDICWTQGLHLDTVKITYGENGIIKRIVCILQDLTHFQIALAKIRSKLWKIQLEESSGKKWEKTGITIMILIHTMIKND